MSKKLGTLGALMLERIRKEINAFTTFLLGIVVIPSGSCSKGWWRSYLHYLNIIVRRFCNQIDVFDLNSQSKHKLSGGYGGCLIFSDSNVRMHRLKVSGRRKRDNAFIAVAEILNTLFGNFYNFVRCCFRYCDPHQLLKIGYRCWKSTLIGKFIAYDWFLAFLKRIDFYISQFNKRPVRYFKLPSSLIKSLCRIEQCPDSTPQGQCANDKRNYFKSIVFPPFFFLAVRPLWFSEIVVFSGWLISSAAAIVGAFLLVDVFIAPLSDRRHIPFWRAAFALLLIGVFCWITFHEDQILDFAVGQ